MSSNKDPSFGNLLDKLPMASSSRKKDIAWHHCTQLDTADSMDLQCLYCDQTFHPSKIRRVKEHLALKCKKVPDDVRKMMRLSLNESISKKRTEEPSQEIPVSDSLVVQEDMNHDSESASTFAIGRFFLTSGIKFDAVYSNEFQAMIAAVAKQGSGRLVRPSISEIRGWILDRSISEMKDDIQKAKVNWGKNGCSILADEWTSNGNIFLTFSVHCLDAMVFIKTLDVSDICSSVDLLLNLFKDIIEEIEPQNVVQVVTKDKVLYADVGKQLVSDFPTIYWASCCCDWVEEILEGFKEIDWIDDVIEEASSFSRYLYNNPVLLNMLRKSTGGVDMVVVGPTRSSTDFLTINQMITLRGELETLASDDHWRKSLEEEGCDDVSNCVSRDSFWVACKKVTNLTKPILTLMKIVKDKEKPGMGYVFAGMYRANEMIKENFEGEHDLYWGIVSKRWKQLPQVSLFVAGFYLNPRFFNGCQADIQNRLRSRFYRCVEKMESNTTIVEATTKETVLYHEAHGEFGEKVAKAGKRDNPGKWWTMIGWECPNLTSIATRILNQTCSLACVKPNMEALQHVNEAKNEVEQQRLSRIVNIQSYSRMKQMSYNKEEKLDPVSCDVIDRADLWVGGRSKMSEWVPVDQPTPKSDLEDLAEVLGEAFSDEDIFNSLLEVMTEKIL